MLYNFNPPDEEEHGINWREILDPGYLHPQQLGTMTTNTPGAGEPDPDFSGLKDAGVDPKILAYLSATATRQKRTQDPFYQHAMAMNNNPGPMLIPQAIAGVNSSLAQLGTINGQVADTSAPHRYADLINKVQELSQKHSLDANKEDVAATNDQFNSVAGLAKGQMAQQTALNLGGIRQQTAQASADKSAQNRQTTQDGINARQDTKNEYKDLNRVKDYAKAMTEAQFQGKTAQQYASLVFGADKILDIERRTASGEIPGGLSKIPMHDLGLATGRLLSGGSVAAQSLVHSVTPKSLWGDIAGTVEYLSNEPVDSRMQEFAKQLFSIARSERAVGSDGVAKIKAQLEPAYSDLRSHPNPKIKSAAQTIYNQVQQDNAKSAAIGGNKGLQVPTPQTGKPKDGDTQVKGGVTYRYDSTQPKPWIPVTGGGQ